MRTNNPPPADLKNRLNTLPPELYEAVLKHLHRFTDALNLAKTSHDNYYRVMEKSSVQWSQRVTLPAIAQHGSARQAWGARFRSLKGHTRAHLLQSEIPYNIYDEDDLIDLREASSKTGAVRNLFLTAQQHACANRINEMEADFAQLVFIAKREGLKVPQLSQKMRDCYLTNIRSSEGRIETGASDDALRAKWSEVYTENLQKSLLAPRRR